MTLKKNLSILTFLLCIIFPTSAQNFLLNPYSRNSVQLLNGKWNAIIDPYCRGEAVSFYKNKKSIGKTEIIEYSFNDGQRLNVPGDFNSQIPELKFYEGNIWYQRTFNVNCQNESKQFLYFAGANYITKVWLNGVFVGQHEGGFLPFQFDISSFIRDGENDLVVLINNNRRADYIPALNFDWWNYGGITRDVLLIETPINYINDYKVQLKKGTQNILSGYVKLEAVSSSQNVELNIPELNIKKSFKTDNNGFVAFEIAAKPQLWEPSSPKLYSVTINTPKDSIHEEIGFRTIETKGTKIFLNGKPIFIKGVSFHEEIAQRMGRAYSEADAAMILSEVKAMGCNFIRTAHYSQNEYIVRMAEKMGLMIWEEIPVWQGIDFANDAVMQKAETMLKEMIYRDKNRAAIIIWSIANETKPSPDRDRVLSGLVGMAREIDNTRLIGAAFDNIYYDNVTSTFSMNDKLPQLLDLIGINKYMGWYMPFPVEPSKIKWNVATDKPLLISEFGCEALYGQHGAADVASSWSEEYQENLYIDNLTMFKNIPNLCGTVPWILFDFRSPNRWHTQNQDGWNRKGLISDKGQRKKAWYIMKKYYDEK